MLAGWAGWLVCWLMTFVGINILNRTYQVTKTIRFECSARRRKRGFQNQYQNAADSSRYNNNQGKIYADRDVGYDDNKPIYKSVELKYINIDRTDDGTATDSVRGSDSGDVVLPHLWGFFGLD